MAKITKTQFVKLQKKHVTDARIGEALGVTRQAVHQLRKKLGIDSAVSTNRDRNAAIVQAYAAGEPGTSIAERYNLSVSHTYRVINAAKDKAKRAVNKSVAKAVAKKVAAKKAAEKKTTVKKTVVKKKTGAKKKKKRNS
ncbi:MAG: hypothetical protein LBU70_02800 [Chitinispirillales bacterium]|jgi:hypothetical protein|nr:hypothetical protein [Chitinispirillales bacterium]